MKKKILLSLIFILIMILGVSTTAFASVSGGKWNDDSKSGWSASWHYHNKSDSTGYGYHIDSDNNGRCDTCNATMVKMSDCTITVSPTTFDYTGSNVTPSTITVTFAGTTLTQGATDGYTVSYDSNRVGPGTCVMTFTGVRVIKGSATKNLTINGKQISNTTISLSPTSYTYDGSEKKPTVTVKDGSTTLTLNTDYTVAYSNNKNAGDATVTITGKGKYTGTKSTTFKINKANNTLTLSATTGSVGYGTASTTFTVSKNTSGGSLSVTDNNSTAGSSISNTTVTLSSLGSLAAGTKVVATVTSAATTNYNSATATYTLTINKVDPSFSVNTTSLSTKKGVAVTATASYNGDGKLSATSNNTGVATVSVSGKTITVTGVSNGSATITVSLAAGTNHNAGSNKTISVTVYTVQPVVQITKVGSNSFTALNGNNTFGGGNPTSVYNNSGGGTVTHAIVNDYSAPNNTGKILRITKGSGTSSPGLGGFHYAPTVEANYTYLYVVVAKIPTTMQINYARNSAGNDPEGRWLTSQVGTGGWQTYIYYLKAGSSGTMSTCGHFYLCAKGASSPTAASTATATWDVAYFQAYKCPLIAWTNQNVTLTATAQDVHSGIVGYTWTTTESTPSSWTTVAATTSVVTSTYTATANGTYFFWAKDNKGNISKTAYYIQRIDKTAPVITSLSLSPAAGTWTNGTVNVVLNATDNASGVNGVAQDNWSFDRCTSYASVTATTSLSNYTVTSRTYNRTSVFVRIKDQAGNTAQQSIAITNIDKTAPIFTSSTTHTDAEYKAYMSKGIKLNSVNNFTTAPSAYQGGSTSVSGGVLTITHPSGNTRSGYQQSDRTVFYYNVSKIYIRKIRANIPTGYTLTYAGNSVNGNVTWLTSNTGTGSYFDYYYIMKCADNTQNNMDGGHMYINGAAASSAFTWTVAEDVTYDVTNIFDDVDVSYSGSNAVMAIKAKDTQSGVSTIKVNNANQTLSTSGTTKSANYTVTAKGTYSIVATDALSQATTLTKNAYQIVYNGNGATSGSTASQIYIDGKARTINNNGFTKTGWTFNGWNTRANGTGIAYTAGQSVTINKNLLNGTAAPEAKSPSTYANSGWRTASSSGGTRNVITISDPPIAGITKGFSITGNGTSLDYAQDSVPISTGGTYTISVYARGTGSVYLQVGNSPYGGKNTTISNVTNWTKYSWTFVAGANNGYNVGSTNEMTNVYIGNHASSGTVEFCGMKLEEGSAATTWADTGSDVTLYAQWVDKAAPTVEVTGVTGGAASIKLTDAQSGIRYWAVTTNQTAPTSTGTGNQTTGNTLNYWYSLTNTTAVTNVTFTGLSGGTYYAWGKDAAGNTTHVAFSGAKASGTGSVTMAGWTYGETAANPVPSSSTNGTDNVTYLYKVQGASDDTYNAAKPLNPGDYTVMAVFAETDTYAETTATANFTIAADSTAIMYGDRIVRVRPEGNYEFDGEVYATLADAYDAVKESGKTTAYIAVLKDNTDSSSVTFDSGKNITLALNGHTVTKTTAAIINKGSLTITGEGTMAGATSISAEGKSYIRFIENTGTISINDGAQVTMNSSNANVIAIYSLAGQVNVDGGSVKVTVTSSSYWARAISLYGNSGLNMYDGEVSLAGQSASDTTVESYGDNTFGNASGVITISGGTIQCTTPVAGVKAFSLTSAGSASVTSSLNISGGTVKTVEGDAIYLNGTTNVNMQISGTAVIEGKGHAINYNNGVAAGNITITGGTLSANTMQAIRTAGASNITISGGKISNTTTGGYGTIEMIRSATGNLTITGGEITGTRQAIWFSSSGNAKISGGEITGGTYGIYINDNVTGTFEVTGGTITTLDGPGISNLGSGSLIIGTNDTDVHTESPVIKGSTYGISSTAKFSFYDGILEGKTAAFEGILKNGTEADKIAAKPTNYSVHYGTDDGYETAFLGSVYNYEVVGGSKYLTLSEAVAAVPTNGTKTTIKVLNDVTETTTVTIADTKNIVLDLDGHIISPTTTTATQFITNKGTLELKDSGTNGAIKFENIAGSTYIILNDTTGTLTVTSGSYLAIGNPSNTSNYWLGAMKNNGTMTVNGGTISGTYNANTSGGWVAGIFARGGSLTINSGDITATSAKVSAVAIANNGEASTAINILGGNIDANSTDGVGYAIDLEATFANGGSSTLDIGGGTITAKTRGINLNGTSIPVNISGGTIEGANYGIVTTSTATGKVTISGGTVKSTNTTAGGALWADGNHEIEVSGGKISGAYNGIYVYKSSQKITISDGEISGQRFGIGLASQASSELEITGGTITTSGNTFASVYSSGSGNISIANATITGVTRGVCVEGDPTGTLTILNGTTITASNGAGVVNTGTGAVIIGQEGSGVNTASPVIEGSTYGVSSNTGFSFYDGLLKGGTNAFEGQVSDGIESAKVVAKESGYKVAYGTDGIKGTAYLALATHYDVAGTKFDTLAEAYAYAEMFEDAPITITVLEDCEDASSVTIADKAIILNLNGHTITKTTAAITNNGTLQIIGEGAINASTASAIINTSSLTIGEQGGNVSTTGPVIQGYNYAVSGTGTIALYDGRLIGITLAFEGLVGDNVEAAKILDKETGYRVEYIEDDEGNKTTAYLSGYSHYEVVDRKFDTLADAYAYAATLEDPTVTIRVLEDVTDASSVTIGTKAIILDLNGHTITKTVSGLTNNGTLTIQDSQEGGMITTLATENNDITTLITNNNQFTLKSGTLVNKANTDNIATYVISGSASSVIDIEGGLVANIIDDGATNVAVAKAITTNSGTIHVSGGQVGTAQTYVGLEGTGTNDTISVSDGYVYGTSAGIINARRLDGSTSTTTVTGGTIEGATGITHERSTSSGNITITGGQVIGKSQSAVAHFGSGIVIVGTQGNGVNIESPVISSNTYAINAENGFNFYDGILKGGTEAFVGIEKDHIEAAKINAKETGYRVEYGTDEDGKNTAYLKADISAISASLDSTTYTYIGQEIEPVVTVLDLDENELIQGEDYTVEYSDNVDVGEATVTITGMGNYVGTVVLHFTITQAMPQIELSDKTAQFTGSPIEIDSATITGAVDDNGNPAGTPPSGAVSYAYYTDFACTTPTTSANSGAIADGEAPVNIGTYYVKATIQAQGNYAKATSSVAILAIEPIHVGNGTGEYPATITLNNDTFGYDGNEHTPTPTVTVKGATLTEGTDYEVSYEKNIDANTENSVPTVVITFKGNYEGTASESFTINAKSVRVDWSNTSFSYDGEEHLPDASASGVEGETIYLRITGESSEVGQHTASAVLDAVEGGRGKETNYTLTNTSTEFIISNSAMTVTSEGYTGVYDGVEHGITVHAPSNATIKYGEASGTYNLDESPTFTDVGTKVVYYQVSQYGYDTVTGSATITITVKQVGTGEGKFEATVTFEDNSFEYDGTEHEPTPLVVVDGDSLIEDVDYEVTYANNKDAAAADSANAPTATITFKGNYSGTASQTFTITKRALTVTPDNKTKTYSKPDPTFTYEVTGVASGETAVFTGALSRATGEDVGTYAINGGTLALGNGTGDNAFKADNYSFTVTTDSNLTISILTIGTGEGEYEATITLDEDEFVYDGTAHEPTPTVVVEGRTLVEGTDYDVTYSNNTDAGESNGTNAPTVTITFKDNYAGTATKEFMILPRLLTITPDDKTKVFGEADPAFTYTSEGVVSDETLVISGALSREAGNDVGTYAITLGTLALGNGTGANKFKASNYELSFTTGRTLTIGAKQVGTGEGKYEATITLSDNSYEYDGTSHTPGVTVVVDNVTLTAGTDYDVTYSNNTDAGESNGENAPTVTITFKGNYAGEETKTFTITKKTLTITPDNQTKVFGTSDPTLTYNTSGVVNGETLVVTGALARAEGEDVGDYAISIGTLTLGDGTGENKFKANNYEVSFTTGRKLTITKKIIGRTEDTYQATITLDNDSFEYNGEAKTPTPTVVVSDVTLVAGTDYDVAYSNNTDAANSDSTNAPTVTITFKGNYEGEETKTFTITKKTLLVTPNNQTKNFGEADPELTYTSSGVVNGETAVFTGALSRESGESVGTYAITLGSLALGNGTGDNKFKASNYEISFTTGRALTIGTSTMTVNAEGYTDTYDGSAHGISVTAPEGASVKYGEASGTYNLDESPTLTNVGTKTVYYEVTKEGYDAVTGSEVITINAATPVVSLDNKTAEYTGSAIAMTGAHASGIAEDDAPNGAISYKYYSDAACETELANVPINVGTYYVKATIAADGNYTAATSSAATLTITAKKVGTGTGEYEATITLDENSFEYDGTEHEPTPTVVVDGVTLVEGTDYDVTYSNNKNANTEDEVTTPTVIITFKGNYSGTTTEIFTITKKTLTVTPNNQTKVFGEADPELTYTSSGVVSGETAVFTGVLTRAAGEDEGTYAITLGTLALGNGAGANAFRADNYELTLTTGRTLTIGAKQVGTGEGKYEATITLDNDTFDYDGTAHEPGVTVEVDGETLVAGTDYDVSYEDNTDANSASNTPTVVITFKGNYAGEETKTFTISRLTITITPDNQTKAYGTSDPTLTYTSSGVVSGETAVFTGALARAEGEDAGEYAINIGTLALGNGTGENKFKAANYEISLTTGRKLTITATMPSIELSNKTAEYNGSAIEIGAARVIGVEGGTEPSGAVSYAYYVDSACETPTTSANSGAEGEGKAPVNAGTYYVKATIAAAGNYAKATSSAATLTITKRVIGDAENEYEAAITLDENSFDYDGNEHEPTPTVVVDGKTLVEGTDYDVTYSNNTDAGESNGTNAPTVTITFKGNYEGTETKTFTINKKSVRVDWTDLSFNYDGNNHVASASATGVTGETITLTVTGAASTIGTHEATATIASVTGGRANANNYTLTNDSVEFTISNSAMTVSAEGYTGEYDGDAHGISVTAPSGATVKYGEASGTYNLDASPTLTNVGTKVVYYQVTQYGYDTVTGSATITITAKKVGTGADEYEAGITLNENSFEYDGSEHEPTPTVVVDGDTLVAGTDYEVTYSNNKNAGASDGTNAPTVTITFKGNYEGTATKTFTITKKSLTVTPDNKTKTYGKPDPTFTYTPSGMVSGETAAFTGALSRASGEDVGTYAITIGTLALSDGTGENNFRASNYEISFTTGRTLTIGAKQVGTGEGKYEATITLDEDSFEYDGTSHTPGVTVEVDGETLVEGTDYDVTYSNNKDAAASNSANAPTVTITFKDNYAGTATKTFTITAKTLTVTPDNQTKVFGEADPTFTYTPSGVVSGETAVFTGALSRASGEDVGTYAITLGTLALGNGTGENNFKAANYELQLTSGRTLTITAKKVGTGADEYEATITLDENSFEYDGTSHTPGVTVEVDGETLVSGTDYEVTYSNNKNAGTSDSANAPTVTITFKGNYSGTATKTFTITKKTLTITPNNQTKGYDEDDPTFTYTYSGNVSGETPVFTGALSREAGTAVGTYAITLGTLALGDGTGDNPFKASNYEISLTTGRTLTIGTSTMSVSAEGYTDTYDGSAHGISVTAPSGAVVKYGETSGTYDLDASPTLTNVGTKTVYYEVTKDGYDAVTGSEVITINAATPVVSLDNKTAEYTGSAIAMTGAHASGIAEDDAPNGAISYKYYSDAACVIELAGAPTDVGMYYVKATIAADGNYTTATSSAATLTITAKVIGTGTGEYEATITLDENSFEYDGTSHTPGVTVEVDGETLVEGTDYDVTYSNNKDAGTSDGANAPTVTITFKGNYEGTATKTFAITKKTLTITPNNQTKVFGAADPELTYTSSGVVSGETAVFTGALERAEGEDVGEYAISIGTLALGDGTGENSFKADNYEVSFTTGRKLTIGAKQVGTGEGKFEATITLGNDTFDYDGTAHEPGVTVVVDGETLVAGTDYDVTYEDNTDANSASNTPTVTITFKGNYAGEETKTFTISRLTITITPDNQTKAYGESDPTLTYTSTGVVSGETLVITGALGRASGENAGEYAINIGTLALGDGTGENKFKAANYELSLTTGRKLVITAVLPSISLSDKTAEYTGSAIEIDAASVSGVEGGTDPSGARSYAYYVDSACETPTTTSNSGAASNGAAPVKAGTYYVKATIEAAGNYAKATSSAATLTITPMAVGDGEDKHAATITLSGNTFEYSGSEQTPGVTVVVEGVTLTEGTDYDVTYTNNTDAANSDSTNAPTVTITFKGNYDGSETKVFTISKKSVRVEWTNLTFGYDGSSHVPSASATGVEGETINLTVSGSATSVGEHTANTYISSVTGGRANASNYELTNTSTTFTISESPIELEVEGYTGEYDGLPHGISITVSSPSGTTVAYGETEGNYNKADSPTLTNVGTKVVYYQVSKSGYTTETGSATITITAKQVGTGTGKHPATITLDDDEFEYDGTSHTPGVTVEVDGETLVAGTDYDVTYSNNKNAGASDGANAPTVTITFKGNYAGEETKTFTISKRTITITPDDKQKFAGRTDPTFTYSVSGALASEALTFTGALGRAAGETEGTYAINLGTLAISETASVNPANYELVVTSGKVLRIVDDSVAPVGTINIEEKVLVSGQKFTDQSTVTIHLTASDNKTATENIQMALINEADYPTATNAGLTWQPFAETITWNLTPGEGGRRVYVIFKDEAGNQSTYLAD